MGIAGKCLKCLRDLSPEHVKRDYLYCSERCLEAHRPRGTRLRIPEHRKKVEKPPPIEKIYLPTPTVGALCELIAASDLLNRGYEVFRAVSPAASCDLIAVRNGKSLRIEVRSSCKRATGEVTWNRPPRDRGRQDHYALVVDRKEVFYRPDLPKEQEEIIF